MHILVTLNASLPCSFHIFSSSYILKTILPTLVLPSGERTPVGIRMSEPPASIPEHWMMCNSARNFRAAVAGLTGPDEGAGSPVDGSMPFRKSVERKDGTSVQGEW